MRWGAPVVVALVVGCGDVQSPAPSGDVWAGSQLGGTAGSGYNLSFDGVQVYLQKYNGAVVAVVVKYVYKPEVPTLRRYPVIVTVKAPVVAGVEKDLVKDGEISRTMPDASSFPATETGSIVFDDLTDIAKQVRGHFDVKFAPDPKKGAPTALTLSGYFTSTLLAL